MLLWGCALWASAAAAAEPEVVVDQEDPPGDSDGPGGYSPPSDGDLSGEDFDLRRFAARVDGNDVVLEVTLGARIAAPGSTWRTNSTPIEFTNGLYLQNIDVYVDNDLAPGSGVNVSIPGRRVSFAEGRTWEAAVVLTPQPERARSVIRAALGATAERVTVAQPVSSRGRTIVARIPWARLGGRPKRAWGWSVHVSGAAWERSFAVVDQFKGTYQYDAFTLPVQTTAERWAFGGGPLGRWHPQVVDVLLPPGVDQHQVLSGYSAAKGAFAEVPFVYGTPPPALPTLDSGIETSSRTEPSVAAAVRLETAPPLALLQPGSSVGHTVVDVAGDWVSILGPAEGLKPMMLGAVLDSSGTAVARVAVTQVIPGGIVATAIENSDKIRVGARVQFAPPRATTPPDRPAGHPRTP